MGFALGMTSDASQTVPETHPLSQPSDPSDGWLGNRDGRCALRPLVTPVLSRLGALAASSAEATTATDAAASLAPGGSYIELDPDGALNALVAHAPAGPDRRQTDPA